MMHQNAYVQQYQQSMMQQHSQMNQMQQQHQQIQMVQMAKRPIAPAPIQPLSENNNQQNTVSSNSSSSKKAKLAYSSMVYTPTQSVSVQRRNARERNRVKQVNNGFTNLRQHIPSEVVSNLASGGRVASKKLSKVDTLKMAVEYIRRLQGVLDDSDDAFSTSSSSASSSASNSYYSSSPVQYSTNQPPASCSDSLPSPTPSYTSDNSSVENSSYVMPTTYNYEQSSYNVQHPEEDDLLDAISWWQQQ